MTDEPFDPVPGQKAALEQLAMEMPQYAAALWTAYDAFVQQGFTAEQAMMLTVALFTGLLGGGS